MPDLPQTLKAYWWPADNFGDVLSPVLLEKLLGVSPQWSEAAPRLLAVGSILTHARSGDTVWGSGCNLHNEGPWDAAGVRCLAVRGPLTREFVLAQGGLCPPIYGDPALLLPMIHPLAPRPVRELAIMPHLDDDTGWNFGHRRGVFTINPGWPWERVVSEIMRSAHIISSSLHGLIVAEAYSIPATWAHFTTRPGKFEDYFLGTDRTPPEPLRWEQAINHRPPAVKIEPPADLLPTLLDWSR